MIRPLKLDNVRASGYVNLRCNPISGCPAELLPFAKNRKPTQLETQWKEMYICLFTNQNIPNEEGIPCCG
jgi:hypothetical protein